MEFRKDHLEGELEANLESSAEKPELGYEGIRAIQGNSEIEPYEAGDSENPSLKGRKFENWANKNVFNGEGQRLRISPQDNTHLDDFGDGVGITKNYRETDSFVLEDGSIWELKSGYENGGINSQENYAQLNEYSMMERAEYVNVKMGDKGKDEMEEKTKELNIISVNYLFDSKAGAEANKTTLEGLATVWYLDDDKKTVKLLK